MRNISDYVEKALIRQNAKSRRELSRMLDLTHASVLNQWEKRGILPTDEHMIALAKAAGVEPESALCDLAIWRAKSKNETQAVAVWENVQKALGPAAAAVLITAALTIEPSDVVQAENIAPLLVGNINYANHWCRGKIQTRQF